MKRKTDLVPSESLQEKINYFYEPYGVAQHMSYCMEFSQDSDQIKNQMREKSKAKVQAELQWPKNDAYKGWKRVFEFMFESDTRSYFYFLKQC